MSSRYLGPRTQPGRLKTIIFTLELVIDKSLGSSDKVIFPESVINGIMREFVNPPNPIIFEIAPLAQRKPAPPQLHCGVLEFTAIPKTARIPYWMTYCLTNNKGERIKEGDKMKFKLIRGLQCANFAQFRPLDKRFARDIQTPRASLEHALRKFTVLTAGQRIPIIHDGKVYPVKVEKVRPSPAGHLIDTNLQVEFTAFDDSKAIYEEEEISGLISGHNEESKESQDVEGLLSEDEFVEIEEIAMYSMITNIAKENKALYFKVKVGNPNFGMRFNLNIKSGDANLYVHYDCDRPSIAQYQWFEESDLQQKVISVSKHDPKFSKWFYIGVHSFQSDCHFTFSVDQDFEETNDLQKDDDKMNGGKLADDDTKPPNSVQCDHCGKWIASQSMMMHSMRCVNINWKCNICDKVMTKSMRSKHVHCPKYKEFHCKLVFESIEAAQRHVLLRHTQIACTLCGCKLFPNQIRSHQEHECAFRKVSCSFCGMKLKFIDKERHEKECGSLTIRCELCGERVTRKWLQNHLASEHNINPTLQTNLVNTIIHSNLGLDQGMDWKKEEVDTVQGLDEDDDVDGLDQDELEDLDPVVKDMKKQFSRANVVSDDVENEETEEEEEGYDDDDDVHEFVCPFCQKYPPKSQDFGEHLANCSANQMEED